MTKQSVRPAPLLATLTLCSTAHSADIPPTSTTSAESQTTLEEIIVAGTPLGGLERSIDRFPGNVQRATNDDMQNARRVGVGQFLSDRLGSVFVNEAQNNPLQPDVQYRGFVASPLLGQPQGIAVYQNGVRINDPFGDTVNWALVPDAAISSVDLIPGSNPVFGLNALGGALSVHTKNGFEDVGTEAEVTLGSFGRTVATIESGGATTRTDEDPGLSYHTSVRYLSEDGWREFSPSDALQVFGNVGWRNDRSSAELSLTRVSTELIGNGPAPVQLLSLDREAVYTHPDRTRNSLTFVTLAGHHDLTPEFAVEGTAYFRRSDIHTLNGDESDFEACDFDERWICEDEDELALDENLAPIPFSESVDGATLNRSTTRQDTQGVSLQLSSQKPIGGFQNQLIAGASFDRSDIRFASSTELGAFDESRRALPGGVRVDESFVDLDNVVENFGLFVTNALALTPRLDVTLAGRYNETDIVLRDQLGTALNGDHTFTHVGGAMGFSYRWRPQVGFYAGANESSRAPSPVELTCADEDDPCALPNAFLSDPPLEQVVARTFEAGARGIWRSVRWHAGAFQTTNEDDIIFISAGALTNRGFFDNVGRTRRQGVELNLMGSMFSDRVSWFFNYTRLQAEFLETFAVASPNNPSAVDGELTVSSGDRMPTVPEQLMNAGVSATFGSRLTLAVTLKYQSDQVFRGDEASLNAPLPSFTVVNASAAWDVSGAISVFAQVDNVLDEDYATFGLYGAADEVLGDSFDDPRFTSPAPPRAAWVGIRWKL